jgi:hypothetical protein
MPRIVNPGTLTTGHGKAAPDEIALRPELSGVAGPVPNIGEIQQTIPSLPGQLAVQSVIAHIDDPKEAHTASAIEHDGHPDILWSSNVEGALDELIGTVLKRPPMLGEWSPDTSFSGIADWGFLKLRDGGLENYVGAGLTFTDATVQNDANVYPYLLSETGPPRDTEFLVTMTDPRSDHQFNWGMESLGEPGMGYGRTHIGAYTRTGHIAVPNAAIFRSGRLFARPAAFDAATGRNERAPVTVSGTIFPADRGVLALIHFVVPRSEDPLDVPISFLAQPLVSDETNPLSTQGRVVAAILLGNGILGDKCHGVDPCADAHLCDGDPGGIFGPGVDADGNYDPFQFPGRASGQYDLLELHLGVNSAAQALKTPWDDLDGDTVAGAQRTPTAVTPAPGQVRLGTDPDAAPLLPVVSNGIPILGGTVDCFTVPPVAQAGSLTFPIHGDAIVRSSNFFRYRLPVLKDYSPATGLKWTPRGELPASTFETSRFFDVAAPSAATYEDGVAVGASLRSAGVYDDFDEDYWVWQVARYRQTFLMPSIAANNVREEAGTYMLVHFKRETDFESFVRDGSFPWDTPAPYEVYGASIVDAPEDTDNLANDWPAATVPVAPDGPAPAYGYAANPWHNIRNRIYLDPVGTALPAVASSALTWTSASAPGGATEEVIWVSGIAYFTPRDIATGASSVTLTACDLTLNPGFWTSYRTDYADLETWPTIGPAVVASQNPAMVALAPWGYAADGALASSLTVPVGAAPGGYIPATTYQDQFRLEVPFTHLGTAGGNPFSDINAPLEVDPLVLALAGTILLLGDDEDPSFSSNAVVRVHFRRPLNHTAANTTNLPYTAVDGHGQLLTHTDPGPVLLHTTRWDGANRVGDYGNWTVGGSGAIEFNTAPKDYTERFLDEGHRYVADAPAGINGTGPYTAATLVALDGPGMGGWAAGPVETPVRVSLANAPWSGSSWLLQGHHLLDLSGATLSHDALQVAGLPDRNPQIKDVNTVPFPSAGLLIYPRTDYPTDGYFPDGTHVAGGQFDYSAAAGDRTYLRCFDAAFSNHATPVAVAGKSDLVVRLDGITLADILYAAPGPGGLAVNRPAVAIKVPGLTTWMDAGRQDGAGPSKQDNLLDGAGCLVFGSETYTFTDPVTGYKGCYLKINVGPVAGLFINPALWSSYIAGSPLGEAPVLVKVSMGAGALSYNLEHRATGVGTFEAGVRPGGESDQVRGLFTMRLVHPNDTLIASD